VPFRDITPLLQDPKLFRVLIDAFVHRYMDNPHCGPTLLRRWMWSRRETACG